MFRIAIFSFVILFPFFVKAESGVILSEIAWMGMSPVGSETLTVASNNEWIELYNSGITPVSLDGWKLVSTDGAPDISLSGSIAAGGYFLLERTDDSTVPGVSADLIYVGALSNSGEHLLLKNASGIVVDEVNASGGWPAGDNTTKYTMQRSGTAWISGAGTPKATNIGSSPSIEENDDEESEEVSSSSSVTSEVFGKSFINLLKAYAGDDRSLVVGSSIELKGYATISGTSSVPNARFWWNFGDGETQEGKNVNHVYRFPGNYTVGLHVSSGEYAASDYLTLTAIPNQVRIRDVLPGEEGFVRISNPAKLSIDIGGWMIEDNHGGQFVVPVKTVIQKGSEIAFANSITSLFKDIGVSYSPILRYPNMVESRVEGQKISQAVSTKIETKVSTPPVEKKETAFVSVAPVSTDGTAKNGLDNSETGSTSLVLNSPLPESKNTAAVSGGFSVSQFGFLSLAVGISFAAAVGFFLLRKFFIS